MLSALFEKPMPALLINIYKNNKCCKMALIQPSDSEKIKLALTFGYIYAPKKAFQADKGLIMFYYWDYLKSSVSAHVNAVCSVNINGSYRRQFEGKVLVLIVTFMQFAFI